MPSRDAAAHVGSEFGPGGGPGVGPGRGADAQDATQAADPEDEMVLDLTEMVAPDGSVVKIDRGDEEAGDETPRDEEEITDLGESLGVSEAPAAPGDAPGEAEPTSRRVDTEAPTRPVRRPEPPEHGAPPHGAVPEREYRPSPPPRPTPPQGEEPQRETTQRETTRREAPSEAARSGPGAGTRSAHDVPPRHDASIADEPPETMSPETMPASMPQAPAPGEPPRAEPPRSGPEPDTAMPRATAARPRSEAETDQRGRPAMSRTESAMLEELVRRALQPMLRDWLDRNLPDLVEEVAAKEIRKLLAERDES